MRAPSTEFIRNTQHAVDGLVAIGDEAEAIAIVQSALRDFPSNSDLVEMLRGLDPDSIEPEDDITEDLSEDETLP